MVSVDRYRIDQYAPLGGRSCGSDLVDVDGGEQCGDGIESLGQIVTFLLLGFDLEFLLPQGTDLSS